jgi:biotin carboxylase
MSKLAILFNTFVKLKTYNFEQLKFDYGIEFIAVVKSAEYSNVHCLLHGVFKSIIISESILNGSYDDIETLINMEVQKYDKTNVRFICLSEDYIIPVAVLREKFGIKGINGGCAEFFRNKVAMKTKLQNFGVIVPRFMQLKDLQHDKNTYDEIVRFLGPAFVIKPNDSFGSKNVSIIKSFEEYLEAISEISNCEHFEVETFIEGKLYHIDSIYKDFKPLFQVCNEYSCPNCDFKSGNALLSLPLTDQDIISRASQLSKQVVEAFNYPTGPTHLEFFITPEDKLVFLEIAARTPGAEIVPMYNCALNANIVNIDLLNHFDLLPTISNHNFFNNNKFYFSGIFPTINGKVTILNEPKVKGNICKFELLVKVGEVLDDCDDLRSISARIIVENHSFEDARNDFELLKSFKAIEVVI